VVRRGAFLLTSVAAKAKPCASEGGKEAVRRSYDWSWAQELIAFSGGKYRSLPVCGSNLEYQMRHEMTALAGWENFYVIVGSSAGALIGLQFVVITLIAEFPIVKDMERASSAFATPTIVHFGSVLLLAAIGSVPWHGIAGATISWGVLGAVGAIYVVIVARRVRIQQAYSPQFEDRLFHVLLPFVGYATLIGSAYAARSSVDGALVGVGAAALLLLYVGIHNAWDAVTYHILVRRGGQSRGERRE
jgi:hypothetical protein